MSDEKKPLNIAHAVYFVGANTHQLHEILIGFTPDETVEYMRLLQDKVPDGILVLGSEVQYTKKTKTQKLLVR